MGMSPQSGLPQNNRAGDFDAFALLHVAKQTGRGFEDLLAELSGKAGLAGMSGTSGDMRDLEEAAAAGSRRARTAIDVYVASIRHWLGAGVVELGGLDAIGFAGGIGENSPSTRAAVVAGLTDLGIAIDAEKNAAPAGGERAIHAASSRVAIWVIPTNEELIVARQARDLLAADRRRPRTKKVPDVRRPGDRIGRGHAEDGVDDRPQAARRRALSARREDAVHARLDGPHVHRGRHARRGRGTVRPRHAGLERPLTPETKSLPIDAVVIGLVDTVRVEGKEVFSRK